MAIEDRNLAVGTRLSATYKKRLFHCSVEKEGDGKLAFVFEDGRKFKSPSSAASAVMGGKAVNGWLFWSVASQEPQIAEEPGKPASKASAAQKRRIYRLPNQKGVAPGSSRWYCNECRKSFVVATGEAPGVCPAGHNGSEVEGSGPFAPASVGS